MREFVKITAGKLRGRKILTPGGKTHPMGERERLALFNMVGNSLDGRTVLDLYAGSGALGLEAASRGASKIVFVEKNPTALDCVRRNIAELGAENCEVIRGDVAVFTTDMTFDIILADPPYDNFIAEDLARVANCLAPNGILVLSHPKEAPVISGLTLEKTRQYAAARLSVYHK